MEKCRVSFLGSINCNDLPGGLCLFLQNENVNSGSMTRLEDALKDQPVEFLMNLANNKGSIYNQCSNHDAIKRAAQNILNKKQK